MKFNKLLLGAVLVTPLFIGSCKTTVTIEDLPVLFDTIYNYGTRTVTCKLTNQNLYWADNVSESDFEDYQTTSLNGKELKVNRKNDTDLELKFSGNIEEDISEGKSIKFNIKTSAFKGTTKVKKAHAETDLARACVIVDQWPAYQEEEGTISFYADFEVHGGEVAKYDQDKFLMQKIIRDTFDDSTKLRYLSKYKDWGSNYFGLNIVKGKYKAQTSSFSLTIPAVSMPGCVVGMKADLKIDFECDGTNYTDLHIKDTEGSFRPTYYFSKPA